MPDTLSRALFSQGGKSDLTTRGTERGEKHREREQRKERRTRGRYAQRAMQRVKERDTQGETQEGETDLSEERGRRWESTVTMGCERAARRHDMDWLRTAATYLVVAYHAAQVFDRQQRAAVKSAELSRAADAFTRFVHVWHMPLFFLLAGWAARASLGRRGGLAAFLGERARKLLAPLLFGLFAWSAPARWVALKHGLFRTATGQLLPPRPAVPFARFLREYYYFDGISWGHLWFLAYLFTFTAIYSPGFWLLSRLRIEGKWVDGLGGWPRWLLANAPVVPLVMIEVTLRDRWPGYQNLTDDWANFWSYSTFFIAGFCLAQMPILEAQLHSSWKVSLATGILSSALCMLPSHCFGHYRLSSSFEHVHFALGGWFMVTFLLWCARKTLSGSEPPPFWTRNAFPVYVVHEVPLFLLADALLESWAAPILVKFLLLTTCTLLLSLVILFLANHAGWLAVLIGMQRGPATRSPTKLD